MEQTVVRWKNKLSTVTVYNWNCAMDAFIHIGPNQIICKENYFNCILEAYLLILTGQECFWCIIPLWKDEAE